MKIIWNERCMAGPPQRRWRRGEVRPVSSHQPRISSQANRYVKRLWRAASRSDSQSLSMWSGSVVGEPIATRIAK